MDAQQLRRVLKGVSLTEERELTCAGLNDEHLAAYADLELAGHDPVSHMPEVHRHLALCPDCRRDYHDVLTTLRLERSGDWIEPACEPNLDLSFLPLEPEEPTPWSPLADRVRRYTTQIPVLMLRELQRLGELPAGLRLRPVSGAPAKMRGPEADTPVVHFRLTDDQEHFAVDLRFRRVGDDVVWIDVSLLDAQTDEALPDTIVGLHEGDGRLLEMRTTVPPGGSVQLRDVPINRNFLLRLEHDGRTWEIPFSLAVEIPIEGE